jgi:hypothetical protein
MNNCYVCKKPSKTHCGNCRKTYYCSKECQKKDWKEHKKSCDFSPVVETIDKTEDDELTELLFNIMLRTHADTSMEDWKIPDFGKEYAKKYPREKEQIQLLNLAKLALIGLQKVDNFLNDDVDGQLHHTMKRWKECSGELKNFLSSPRRVGDIFTKKTKYSYRSNSVQSFSNTPKRSLSLDQGKVHVAVGFVDLDLLLRARIAQSKDSIEKSNKFIGYEASAYAVAKTNVIKEMMMGKAPIRSIIEVWFSAVWTMNTLKHFKDAVKKVLQYGNAPNDGPPNSTKNELHSKVRLLISHWSKSIESPKTRQEAHKLWAKTFDCEDGVFSVVANLVEPQDRVQVARYILTGEFPLMDDQQQKNLIASITMFNYNYIPPHRLSEFMFEMMPLDHILSKNNRKITPFLKAIYNFLEDSIAKVCAWLLTPTGKTESIEIYLHFQSVNNDNPALHASIRQLEPSTMSWSNIGDYIYAHDFHKLLRACSGKNTVHSMISMNWITETFGAHIMDYYNIKRRREIYTEGQKEISKNKSVDKSGYFRYDKVITHPYNIGDISATMLVRNKWKDYLFRGQNMKVSEILPIPFSHTHKIHTFLDIHFTYA